MPESAQERKDLGAFLKTMPSEPGNLSPQERSIWQRFSGTPNDLSPEFKNWLKQFVLAEVVPEIPVYQLQGWAQFSGSYAEVAASEAITSTSYTDLTTSGPSLTGLSPGIYLILFGAKVSHSDQGGTSRMSLSLNGSTATDADGWIQTNFSGSTSPMRAIQKTLSESSNSITCKYKVGGGTGTWSDRWLITMRTGNV